MNETNDVERLRALLEDMVVPVVRRETLDLPWLARNLGIHNSDNPNFKEAISLIIRVSRSVRYNS